MKHRHVEQIAALALLALITLAACVDAQDDQDLDLKHHCEMTQLYATSKGEYGWPDYNNTAHLCEGEKA
jgi:hypothetical protein